MDNIQIFSIAYDYIGSICWLVLFLVSLIYLFYKGNKKQRRALLLVIIVSVVLIYNDFSRKIIAKFYDESYYRFFWLVPFIVVVAIALTVFLTDKDRVKKWQKALVIIVTAAALAFTNESFFTVYLDMPVNFWLLSRDVFPMADIIQEEKEEERPTIIFPEELEYNYRTYDSNCQYAIHRDAYETFIADGYAAPDRSTDLYDDFVLANTVTNHVQMSQAEFKTAVIHKQADFLVVHIDDSMRPYFENLGFELVGNTYNYQIYKYKYNYYSTVSSDEEAEARLENTGIHIDEIEIDLDECDAEKTLLVINDIHTVLSDSSVTDENRATVDERFNWAVNSSGAKSIDSFLALTSSLDYIEADAIYYAGDIFDYQSYTGGNLYVDCHNKLNQATRDKITYLRADHDIGNWYTNGGMTDEDTLTIQTANTGSWQNGYINDYGDFVVVGWNNSTSGISDPQFLQDALDAIYGSKPVILITHVPLDSKVNDIIHATAASVDDKGRIKLWGGSDSLYVADELTQQLLDAVYDEKGMCRAVISGHLHAEATAPLTNTCVEYIRDASFKGGITRFVIK